MAPQLFRIGVCLVLGIAVALSLMLLADVLGLKRGVRELEESYSSIDLGSAAAEQETVVLEAVHSTNLGTVTDALIRSAEQLRSGDAVAAGKLFELAIDRARLALSSRVHWLSLSLSLAVLITGFLVLDLVQLRRRNPWVPIISEVTRINSGRVPAAMNFFSEAEENLEKLLGYVEVLETKRKHEARRYAQEIMSPVVIETLQSELAEVGSILREINTYLQELLSLCRHESGAGRFWK